MDGRKRYLSSQLFSSILEDDLGLAEHLLNMGADPNLLLEQFGMMPFHVAVGEITRPELFTLLLLNYAADPNVRSHEGLTPLHVACIYNNCQCVELLIQHGGNPFLIDQEGKDAFWCLDQTQCRRCRWNLEKHLPYPQPEDSDQEEDDFELTPTLNGTAFFKSDSNLKQSPDQKPTREEQTTMYQNDGRVPINGDCLQVDNADSSEASEENDAGDWTYDRLSTVVEEDEDALSSNNNARKPSTVKSSVVPEWNCNPSTPSYSAHSQVHQPGNLFPSVYNQRISSSESSPTDSLSPNLPESPNSPYSSPDQPKPILSSNENFPTLFLDEEYHSPHQEHSYQELDCSDPSMSSFFQNSTLLVRPLEHSGEAVGTEASFVTCDSQQKEDEQVQNPADDVSHLSVTLSPEDPILYESSDCSVQSFIPSNVESDDLSIASETSKACPSGHAWTLSQFFKNLSFAKDACTGDKDKKENSGKKGTKTSHRDKQSNEFAVNGHSDDNHQSPEWQDNFPEITDDESVWNDEVYCVHDYAIRKGSLSRNNSRINDSGVYSNPSRSFVQPKSSSRNCTAANSMLFDASCSTIQDTSHIQVAPSPNSAFKGPTPPQNKVSNALKPSQNEGSKPPNPSQNMGFKAPKPVQTGAETVVTSPLTEAALKLHQSKLSKGKEFFLNKKICGSVQSAAGSAQTADSKCSCQSAATVRYVYTDDEADSVVLVETHFPVSNQPCDAHNIANESVVSWQDLQVSSSENKAPDPVAVMGIIRAYSTQKLREELEKLGDRPGPIVIGTRAVYERRLHQLRLDPSLARVVTTPVTTSYPAELEQALSMKLDVSNLQELEDKMSEPFQQPDPNRRWREGHLKSSFIYLLLDPRITKNLPNRTKQLGDEESFRTFVRSIFYVGKGKRARPYAHFKEAIKHDPKKTPGKKVGQILSIWNDGEGVVSLHIFQSILAVEAYTREAAIIDAIGISRLTNVKLGDYYGPACTWPSKKKRLLGVRLLKKAFRIFLSEGERQIRPSDLKV